MSGPWSSEWSAEFGVLAPPTESIVIDGFGTGGSPSTVVTRGFDLTAPIVVVIPPTVTPPPVVTIPAWTFLQLVQDIATAAGFPTPAAAVGSLDQTARTLVAIANKEGKVLARRWTWMALQREYVWSTVPQTIQFAIATAIPDFDYLLNETMFSRSIFRQFGGPLTPHEWQRVLATTALPHYPHLRVQGGNLLVAPVPDAGNVAALEYMSSQWVLAQDGTRRSTWQADTDTSVLDYDILALGILWRFKQAKGLDYAEEFGEYERRIADAIARDGARHTMSLDTSFHYDPRLSCVPPDGSWRIATTATWDRGTSTWDHGTADWV